MISENAKLFEDEDVVVCGLIAANVSELGRRELLRQLRRKLLRLRAVGICTAEQHCKIVTRGIKTLCELEKCFAARRLGGVDSVARETDIIALRDIYSLKARISASAADKTGARRSC